MTEPKKLTKADAFYIEKNAEQGAEEISKYLDLNEEVVLEHLRGLIVTPVIDDEHNAATRGMRQDMKDTLQKSGHAVHAPATSTSVSVVATGN